MKNDLLFFILILMMACGSEKQDQQLASETDEKRDDLQKYLVNMNLMKCPLMLLGMMIRTKPY